MLSSSDTRTPVIVSDKKELRRCVMNEWSTYNGLGLILKSNRVEGQPNNLIRQVELGSPAHYAGVLPNDLIIRVNNRYVEFEKFDYVFKMIRNNLKRDKRIELMVLNADYIDEFKKKLSSHPQLKKADLSSTKITQFVKNYQSPLVNPNIPNQTVGNVNNQPRLCHLLTWPNYDGYGFYVAYTNNGCFVKNVEPNSPAHLGGLRDYDRILEISGKQINDASDRNIVNKLIGKRKLINSSTVRSKSSYLSSRSSNNLDNNFYLDVFVCDPNTYKYLKERKVDISSRNKNLRILECFTPSQFEIGQKISHNDVTIERENSNHELVDNEDIELKRCLIRRVSGREDEPLGFEMTKRGNTANFISRVEANSVAEQSGLRQDDYIIELNEKNVENDDNSLLKDKIFKHLDTDGEFKLTIINRQGYEYCRDKKISPDDYIKSNGHKLEYFKTPFVENVAENRNTAMDVTNTKTRLCVLEKKSENDELGLSIARYKNIDQHIVSDVIEGSLAHKAGIRQNDCLIEVNGVNVEKMSHADTINLIASLKKMSSAQISFLVEQNQSNLSSQLDNIDFKKPMPSIQTTESIAKTEGEKVAQLDNRTLNGNKPPSINVYPEIKVCEFIGYPAKTQLGLVITSDDYSHDVVKVNDDSPAQRAGLAKGDVILAVNGQTVENNPSSIELMNDFSETKPLRVVVASRYAYEWSKLLKININEKDWPNIKKCSTRWVPEHSLNHTHKEHYQQHNNNYQQPKQEATANKVEKYYQTINSTMRSNYSNLSRSAVDITADGKVLRLCSLVLDPTSPNPADSEFGFDLVTKIGANRRIGDYFIDTVDMYSPACCSGLKPGDRLVEVDGHDVSACTFEQVVQMINEARLRSRLKLLVYPGMAINYANQNIIPELREEHVISNEHFNQTYTSVESARSMPDLTAPNRSIIKTESLDILRPVPRLCTIYKQDLSNIGFGIQVKNTSQIIPNYLRVNVVNFKSPSYLSGMQSGDLIVEINGRNTLSMTWDEALHYIKTSYEVNGYVKILVASEFCYNWLRENQMLTTLNSENANTFSYADYLKSQPRHEPRMCRIRLFPFSKSFGFSIESMLIRPISASKSTSYAHIINRVDKESPAYASRVQKGDRIVEFDGYNVENENQQQLLDRIYQAYVNAKNISLLLVDSETDNYFKSKCIRLHGMLPIVQHITNSTEI